MTIDFTPPAVADREKVGTYPAHAKAGGGYVWDDVLEYRVWCRPEHGAKHLDQGNDHFYAFATHAEAVKFAKATKGAEAPLALTLQREFMDEPEPGHFVHVRTERVAEWPVAFLKRPRRTDRTIPEFMSSDAPPNRLAILRGEV